jgi:hypothetical protein
MSAIGILRQLRQACDNRELCTRILFHYESVVRGWIRPRLRQNWVWNLLKSGQKDSRVALNPYGINLCGSTKQNPPMNNASGAHWKRGCKRFSPRLLLASPRCGNISSDSKCSYPADISCPASMAVRLCLRRCWRSWASSGLNCSSTRTAQKILLQAHNCRNQAIAQLCAFHSPFIGLMSGIEIFH